jgi:hypothetical protein
MKSKIHEHLTSRPDLVSKTKQIVMAALVLATAALAAQNNKPATVHIKTKKIVNGVETTTDTTFTTTDPSMVGTPGSNVQVQELKGTDGTVKKMIVINGNGTATISDEKGGTVIKAGDQVIHLEEEMDKAMKGENMEGKTVIIKKGPRCNATAEDLRNAEEIEVTIIKKINMTDASAEDMRLLGKPASGTDGKLSVEKMEFYPNPNNGRFNLSFTLPDKGDTEVKVMDLKGQQVFSEKLGNFSGSYSKEIDISKNPKGAYFIRVEQGQHALVKKVVVD